ncbi:UDP-glucose 4-epimerase GalE [Acidisoma silvae]|uniref:UDP-glucose 4-epimerase n=1 Tax=Acidisoma silvae TaxID=2802396 RepID=A0A964DY49_9PROT|nr:UDP-glucose 4-epimerase GalE [Acidisoma silvae]MCB8874891.1 UDP-glucose 4-epimerase GalE [Acidisoma silvae]
MSRKRFLVTGGAGFVGSHLVAALLEQDADVTVLDNLSLGHRAAVLPGAKLIVADLSDAQAVDDILSDGPWDAVFHFASLSLVGESMKLPFKYLLENGVNGMKLIEACVRHKVSRFVLSSTANLFGTPERIPIDEAVTIEPHSPYGESKFMIERALHWANEICGLRSACLRYFNAAGADARGRIGEDHDPETHLIPLAIDAVLGRRPPLAIFGNDYPTPDGTCIRDYIHVEDLADAHIRVLDQLTHRSVRYNVGTGRGYSVTEIIESVGRVAGRPVPAHLAPRRLGDPAVLIAGAESLRADTGWSPRYTDLDAVVETAFRWREAHAQGYDDRKLAEPALA